MTHLDPATQRSEIERTDVLLRQICGQDISRYWRAPYGARNADVLRVSSEAGFVSVYWTIDSLDSDEPPKSPAFLTGRILNHTDAQLDGAIILMHVGEPATAEALTVVLHELKRRGFKPVTISKLLGADTTRWLR